MNKVADLHIHTHFSDGTLSPQEAVAQASLQGLSCIAITDHDTIDGIAPTMQEAQSAGIEVISGIELSSEFNGKDIHMLGYLFDYKSEEFCTELRQMQILRIERIKAMIEKMHGLGLKNVSFEEVMQVSQDGSVGRPHLAAVLMQKGYVGSIQEAFNKFLAEGASAYVSKFKLTPHQAIEMIVKAGGVAVMAHPMITNKDELIPSFVEAGMKGIEVFYPNCSETVTNYYLGIAEKHGLVATGGSDAHGESKKHTYIGKVKIPYHTVEHLKDIRNG